MSWLYGVLSAAMVVAVWIAYWAGSRSQRRQKPSSDMLPVDSAATVTQDLRHVSERVSRRLVAHHASIMRFKERLQQFTGQPNAASWQELSHEADRVLEPTLELAHEIERAYEQLRQQASRVPQEEAPLADSPAGVSSRRTMEEILRMLFAMKSRHGTRLSVALIDIDDIQKRGRPVAGNHAEELLNQFARLLRGTARESDVIVKCSGSEFLAILPHTDGAGACVFAHRVRRLATEALSVTLSIGVAEAGDDDTMQSLLAKADAALYGAKAAGTDQVFRHTGHRLELVPPPAPQPLGRSAPLPEAAEVDIDLPSLVEELAEPLL